MKKLIAVLALVSLAGCATAADRIRVAKVSIDATLAATQATLDGLCEGLAKECAEDGDRECKKLKKCQAVRDLVVKSAEAAYAGLEIYGGTRSDDSGVRD